MCLLPFQGVGGGGKSPGRCPGLCACCPFRAYEGHIPVFYGAGLAAERCTYLIYRAGVGLVGPGVATVVDLLQGLRCRAVELELEDVDVAAGLDDTVGASLR